MIKCNAECAANKHGFICCSECPERGECSEECENTPDACGEAETLKGER